jgi:soluble lytic murein transglycosylase-like protein
LPLIRNLFRPGAAILLPLLLYGCSTSSALQPKLGFAPRPTAVAAAPDKRADEPAVLSSIDPSAAPEMSPAGYAKADRITRSRSEVNGLIEKYAAVYDVPPELVHRVVKRESTYNPRAHNKGHWGLMQIKHATARGMGYRGSAQGLLDAETNLKYAVKYLKGAYVVAGGNQDLAVRYYSRGYYYDAKKRGLLEETGLGRDRRRRA